MNLIKAIRTKILKKIQETIEENPNEINELYQGKTPLYEAIQAKCSINILKLLLKNGADPNQVLPSKTTNLHCAIENDVHIIKELLKRGADVNIKNIMGNLPLHICNRKCTQTHIIKKILKNTTDINAKNRTGSTALHIYSSSENCNGKIQLLLESNADPNIRDHNDKLPIQLYCEQEKAAGKIVKLFLKKGSLFDFSGTRSPIHLAVTKQNEEVLRALLHNGSNPNLMDENKNTPLHYLYEGKSLKEMTELLLNYGGDPFLKNQFEKDSVRILKILGINLKQVKKNLSYINDFENLLTRKELTDCSFKVLNKTIPFHKSLVESRLNRKIDEETLTIIDEFNIDQIEELLYWVYTGKIKNYQRLKNTAKRLGINNFLGKSHLTGLRQDITNMYHRKETYDFTVIVRGSKIKAHKCVLQARSNLYRGLFLTCSQDNTDTVHDYTKTDLKALRALIYFFYTDSIKPNLPIKIVGEMYMYIEYFQLNDNSSLIDKLNDYKKNRSKQIKKFQNKNVNSKKNSKEKVQSNTNTNTNTNQKNNKKKKKKQGRKDKRRIRKN
ncbi:molting protein mlt-4 [Anaeramoeba flamelloides]|uniref:Molting protein mlt-4 n=1 Tax=Anaeramoeba flamelloides TaxID=1746091 RepID=A0AAV7YTH8_9EUKA|nr:molting protein mlt-4 [Anaeramoeba flamelloides]